MSNTPTLEVFYAEGAHALQRGSEESAGLDISAKFTTMGGVSLASGERFAVPTGVHVKIPKGYYGRIAPRSGLAYKYGIDVLAGVIDSDYRGEIKVIVLNTGEAYFDIEDGDRIAQLIIEKIAIPDLFVVGHIDDLGSTDRGEKGFGSTGL